MRIAIDLQGAQTGSRFRGIGRYTIALIKAMLRENSGHEYILVLNGLFEDTIEPIRAEFNGLIRQDHIVVWEAHGPVQEITIKNSWRRETAALLREAYLESLNADVVLITSVIEGYGDDFVMTIGASDTKTPTVAIFYDIIPYLYPDIYLADKFVSDWYYRRLAEYKKADLLLAISNSSRLEAIEHLDADPASVVNISAACDGQFRPIAIDPASRSTFFHRFGIEKPYLMYLSATDPRKNHRRLIDAYARLPCQVRAEHQLIFVGGMPSSHKEEFQRHAENSGLKPEELVFTGFVDDDDINLFFNFSKAFVFPSWHEGFGLPALEAMQCGCAVIGSRASSVPEVIGYDEALFDPFDVEDMRARIERVLTDDEFRSRLKHHAATHVTSFSWEKCAKFAIRAMEERFLLNVGDERVVSRPHDSLVDHLVSAITALDHQCVESDLAYTAVSLALNLYRPDQKQIFLDISEIFVKDAGTGIQRVVRNIVNEFMIAPPSGYKICPVYATREHSYRYAGGIASGDKPASVGEQGEFVKFGPGDVFLGLDLIHPDIAERNRDFYHLLRKHGVLVKFVVYDLLPLQLPQYCNTGVPEGYERWLNVVSESDGAICISKAVADDLRTRLLKQSDCRRRDFSVGWFHLGSEITPTGDTDQDQLTPQLSSFFVGGPVFLMVGTLEPRKGYLQALDSFTVLWERGIDVKLLIVGKRGWKVDSFVERLKTHPENGKRLIWLEGPQDAVLQNIYLNASCLLAASEGEGFGLPIIEAARHGLPIIARDLAVFREVAGANAVYFRDELGADVVSDAVEQWIKLWTNAQAPDPRRIHLLSWKESAEQLFLAITADQLC